MGQQDQNLSVIPIVTSIWVDDLVTETLAQSPECLMMLLIPPHHPVGLISISFGSGRLPRRRWQ
jgi:hypothetical protein